MDTLGADTLTDEAPPSAAAAGGALGGAWGAGSTCAAGPEQENPINCKALILKYLFEVRLQNLTCCSILLPLELLLQTLCFTLCVRWQWRRRRALRRFLDWGVALMSALSWRRRRLCCRLRQETQPSQPPSNPMWTTERWTDPVLLQKDLLSVNYEKHFCELKHFSFSQTKAAF